MAGPSIKILTLGVRISFTGSVSSVVERLSLNSWQYRWRYLAESWKKAFRALGKELVVKMKMVVIYLEAIPNPLEWVYRPRKRVEREKKTKNRYSHIWGTPTL